MSRQPNPANTVFLMPWSLTIALSNFMLGQLDYNSITAITRTIG